jgi:hypothetical protein
MLEKEGEEEMSHEMRTPWLTKLITERDEFKARAEAVEKRVGELQAQVDRWERKEISRAVCCAENEMLAKRLQDENAALRGAVSEYEFALEFYRDHINWLKHPGAPCSAIIADTGTRAMTALNKGRERLSESPFYATERQVKVEAVIEAARKVVNCPSCKKSVFCGSELVNALAALEKEGGMR